MKLSCVRIDSTSGHKKTEIHMAEVRKSSNGELWIHLVPGVTGYESASVKNLLKRDEKFSGWSACAGTPNSWDCLYVPQNELDRLTDFLRLIPQ